MAAKVVQRATAPDGAADGEPARHNEREAGSGPSPRDAEEDAEEDMQASLARVSEEPRDMLYLDARVRWNSQQSRAR